MRAPLAFLLALSFSAPAFADRYILTYEGVAFGVAPLGAVRFDAEISATAYQASSTLRSGGLLALFERTRLSALAEGAVLDGAVQPLRYDLDHFYSRKHRATTLAWRDGVVEAQIAPTYRVWGDPPVSDDQRAGSRDPVSTLVAMGIDVARNGTCVGAYPTFDGRFHYVMRLSSGRRQRFDDGGFEGEALRCQLHYEPVSGFEADDTGRRMRVRRGEIWFGLVDGDFAPPVRFSAPLPVGHAVISLTQWQRARVEIAP